MIFYQNENIGKAYNCSIGVYENWYISPHIHEFSEFAFSKNKDTCVYLDGKRYIVPKNHLIYIKPNQVHEYSEETSSIVLGVVFSNDLNPLFNTLTLGNELVNPVIDFSDHLQLIEDFEKVDQNDKLKVCGLLNLICGIVYNKGEWTPTRILAQKENGLRQIVDYVANHFMEDIKLIDLAKRLGYHEKRLSTVLHSLTGMNFRKFLATHRINYAKRLLRETNPQLRMTEVALKCGFSSINTFNRMFLSLTGVTPTEYRAGFSK